MCLPLSYTFTQVGGVPFAFLLSVSDQEQLLLPGQALQMPFAAQRFLPIFEFLEINQLHRSPAPGVLCTPATVVDPDSVLQIRGPAAVERVVRTAEQIDVIHARFALCPGIRRYG